MSDKQFINYASGDYRQRLKPYLFWLIFAAFMMVLLDIIILFAPDLHLPRWLFGT